MNKKTFLTLLVIAAIIIAAYLLLKRRKNNTTVVNINDVTKGGKAAGDLQLLAQAANGANTTVLPGQDGFPLKQGSKGSNVAKLQVALLSEVTGSFDADLEKKVIAAIGVPEVTEEKFKYLVEARQWQPFLNVIPSVHNAQLSADYYKSKAN